MRRNIHIYIIVFKNTIKDKTMKKKYGRIMNENWVFNLIIN